MADRRRKFNPEFVHLDYDAGYQNARKQVEDAPAQRGRGRGGRSSRGMRSYQEHRVQTYRKQQSKITEDNLSEELKKKLFPGVKDGQTASERLEAVNTFKAITLTVTTRAIGFGTMHIFLSLFEFANVPQRGDIYQLYRVGLAVFQAKLQIVQRSVTCILYTEEDYETVPANEDLIMTAKGILNLPDQLTSVINAIGKVKISERLYIPKMGKYHYTRNHAFLPQPEQVTFNNLRNTVVALNDARTPIEYRRTFYQNNPIPGAIWEGAPNDPVLVNPEEIMPEDYDVTDLADDIDALRAKMNHLNKKGPKYFTKPVNFEDTGTKSMLVCNSMNKLRCIDRRQGEGLLEYYSRMKISGDIDEYFNIERLTTGEQIDGNIALLGESPEIGVLKYPIYLMRDKRICSEFSNLKYKASRNIKYT